MGVRNFIDRVFTVISDLILKLLPASKQEKQAFAYYKAGMAAQAEGDYAEALEGKSIFAFDHDTYKLLLKALNNNKYKIVEC